MMLQIALGIILALIIWHWLKWMLQTFFGLLGFICLVLMFPGLLLVLGGFVFLLVGLAATLGVLLIIAGLRP